MGRMISMHYLDIEETNLQEMPPNMGKLIKLQTLTDFFVGKREGCGVKELGSLQHLREKLRIHNLQNVVNAKDTLEAKIKGKKKLKELELYWKGGADDSHHQNAVLDGLQPHTEIEVISIDGYGGTSFPNWFESGAFLCLKELWVINCRNLKGTLPSHFPSLTKLVIRLCPQLENCVPNAPNLSSLELENGDYLLSFSSSNRLAIIGIQESVLEKIGKLGSSLEEITIREHEPLKCFPLELFPNLKSLRIEGCAHFESFCTPSQKIFFFEFLTQLILEDCPKLKCLPERMLSLFPALLMLKMITCPEIGTFSRDGLPLKLQSLTIANCNKLIAGRMHWDLQKLTSLTSFSIEDYEAEEMESFPEVTLLPSVLTSLEICNLPYLKSLNYEELQHFDCLEKLIIKNCCRLQLVPDEGLPSTVTHLNKRFHDLTRLRELRICFCPEIASLPEEGLPPNLITLELDNLQKLMSVEGLRHLTSLKSLTIWDCPHLQTLPVENLPSTLTHLGISNLQNFRFSRRFRLPRARCAGLALSHEIASHGGRLNYPCSQSQFDRLDCHEIASQGEWSFALEYQNLRPVEGWDLPSHVTSLESLTISDCPHLKSLPEVGLPSSLSCLKIRGCPEIASLPKEGLPPNLITLELDNLQNLRTVEGLRHLSSLESLTIDRCPHLKTLPEEGLPSSLSSLKISRCPLLKKWYRRKKGKYWAKISHISDIDIKLIDEAI